MTLYMTMNLLLFDFVNPFPGMSTGTAAPSIISEQNQVILLEPHDAFKERTIVKVFLKP